MSKCLWKGWKWKKGYKEIAFPFTCYFVNREYSWKKSQTEKKCELFVATYKNRLLVYGAWKALWIFHDWGSWFCRTNHWTGFYTTGTSVRKELMLNYLIMTKQLTSMAPNFKGSCFYLIKLLSRLPLGKHVKLI